jgi:hypothetical protein
MAGASVSVNPYQSSLVKSFLDRCAQQAEEPQASEAPAASNYSYVDNSWNWYSFSSPSTDSSCSSSKDKERDRACCNFLAVACGIAILASSVWFLGKISSRIFGPFSDAFHLLQDKRVQKLAETADASGEDTLRNDLRRIAHLQQEIDSSKITEDSGYFVTLVGTALGGSSLIYGGMQDSSYAKSLGVYVTIASAALGLFTYAYYRSSYAALARQNGSEAQKILKSYDPNSSIFSRIFSS